MTSCIIISTYNNEYCPNVRLLDIPHVINYSLFLCPPILKQLMCVPIYNLKRGTLYIQIPWTKPICAIKQWQNNQATICIFPASNTGVKLWIPHRKRTINTLIKFNVNSFFLFCFLLFLSQLISNISCLSAWYTAITELRRGMNKPSKEHCFY